MIYRTFTALPVGATVVWTADQTVTTSRGDARAHLALLNVPGGDRIVTVMVERDGSKSTTGTAGFGYGDSAGLVAYVFGCCLEGALHNLGVFDYRATPELLAGWEADIATLPAQGRWVAQPSTKGQDK